MGFVTSIFARRMIEAAGDEVDADALLRSVGLDPAAPLDVGQMIAAEAYYDLLERIARTLKWGHELPLRVGPCMRLDDYGALGLAWKAAPDVRHSLERVERYCRLWTDNMAYRIVELDGGPDGGRDGGRDGGIEFQLLRDGERRLGMRLSNEATLASAVSLIRQSSSARFRPRAVLVRHGAPASTSAHEAYFGCPVHFGADRDALSIPGAALDRPNHLGDDGISRFLLSHLEREVREVAAQDPVETLVEQAVSRALSEGVPRMAEIARQLAMSERTLHRRLAERGLTFTAVVDVTRRRLAESLLRRDHYSLTEIAFLTGFSEQSAFQRAFKRWFGRTPAVFRREPGAADSHGPGS